VSLTFGGVEYSILPEAFNLGFASEGSSDCVGGVSASGDVDFWIVGDVFLRVCTFKLNVLSHTDHHLNVSFAVLTGCLHRFVLFITLLELF
jgi:hypothetical protein